MTKEEIKQRNESKEFLKDLQYYLFQNKRSPKIDKLSVLLDNDEKRIADLKEEINKIAFARGELEKENAELKADNDARKFAMAMSEKVEKQLREENAELKRDNEGYEKDNTSLVNQFNQTSAQLTNAKEIIKELYEGLDKLYLSGLSNKQIAFIEQLQDKAEQFLSEVEK